MHTPPEGGTFAFGNNIPYTVTVTDPEDASIDCIRVIVTFVLGHDTHGHAEQSVTGCSGVLHDRRRRTSSHGGNVFGVVSASYTDTGGAGGTRPISDDGAEEHPPEAPGGRVRGHPVRHQHGDHDRRAAAARTAAASRRATGSSSTGRSTW